nr:nucleotidyltransferase domain-containing protein [uncultured Prevotella sp.]
MDRESALMIVRSYKEAIRPLISNAKVYLYGSCSRNEAHKDSDIDVAVIVPKLQGDWLDTTSSLWLATLDVNTSIEPVLIEECKPSPLYENVLRNGIVV